MTRRGRKAGNLAPRSFLKVGAYDRTHNGRSKSIQGHPRLLILVPIESACAISY